MSIILIVIIFICLSAAPLLLWTFVYRRWLRRITQRQNTREEGAVPENAHRLMITIAFALFAVFAVLNPLLRRGYIPDALVGFVSLAHWGAFFVGFLLVLLAVVHRIRSRNRTPL